MVPVNNLESTLTVAYKEGTATEIALASITNFPTSGVVTLDDGQEWVIKVYDSTDVGNKKLQTLSNAIAVYASAGASGHTFAVGTEVWMTHAADYYGDLVVGPAAATNNALARFDGVTGKIVQDSGIIVNDTDDISGVHGLTATGNLDIGAHDFRARNLTADALTAARVVFTGANGLLSEEAGFAWVTANKRLDITRDAIGATQGDYGLLVQNTTAAAAGSQQWSPPIRWRGYGWETDGTSSMSVDFRAFVRPIQGTAAPTGALDFQASINGGAYSDIFSLTSGGSATLKSSAIGASIPAVNGLLVAGDNARIMACDGEKAVYFGVWGDSYAELSTYDWDAVLAFNFVFLANGGNLLLGTNVCDGTANKCFTLVNGTAPAAHTDNQIYIYSKDSVGSAGATVGFTTESPVVVHDAGGAWTISHKWFVWIDGAEYSISLDAV